MFCPGSRPRWVLDLTLVANRNGLDAPGDGGRAAAVDEGRPLEARFLLEKAEGFFWGGVLLIWPCISIFTNSFFWKNIFSTVLGPQFSHGFWCCFFGDGIWLAMAVLFHVLVGVDCSNWLFNDCLMMFHGVFGDGQWYQDLDDLVWWR